MLRFSERNSAEPALAPGLSPEEAELVRACLAPVGQRPATAEEVAQRLEALAAPQLTNA